HDMVISDFDRDGKFDIATNAAIYFQNTPDSWTTVSGANYSRTGFGVGLLDIGEGTRPGHSLGVADPGSPPPLQPPPPSGALDLVGTGPGGSPYANYWYENPIHTGGNPRTQQWVRHYFGPTYDSNYSLGGYTFDQMDVNEDGRMDIVTAQSEQPNDFGTPPAEGLAWWEAPANRRTGTWIRHQIDVGLTQMHKTRVADINLDGREDLVVAEQEQSANDRVAVLFKQPDFSWRIQVLSIGSGHNVTTADIDGDGDFDILNAAHAVYGAAPQIDLFVNGARSLSADAAPEIKTHPISRRINAGQSVTFVVAATGAAPLSFQWQKNGVDILGATNAYYTLTNATFADNNAKFSAVVSNSIDVVISTAATIIMAPASALQYLSDMNPTFQSNGWGPYERDRSNGDTGANDGQAIRLNGVTYAKGLGVHAASELRYALNGVYQSFLTDVGVDDEVGSAGSIVFQVWADGTKLFDSGTMSGTTTTKAVNVSVAGKNELRLIVTDSGNGNNSDHGDWANARLSGASISPGAAPAARATTRLLSASIWNDLIEPDELPLF
ncbi:MAG: NPCBM/NEW2 domain-containing protein, partial [Anaerolineae bacterium]|nr:NPCBM/NEW2 domain-containing protein [Phycisphaerae bacterium]